MIKKVEIAPLAFIIAAFWLLVLPLQLLLAAMAAAMFHEFCHYVAIRLCGSEVLRLRIGTGGMSMETDPMTAGQELLCAMAGPGGSFLLVLLYPWMPWIALCALIQGCYNLLPLYPLDGGRCLRCGLELLFPDKWGSVWNWVHKGLQLLLIVMVVWLTAALKLGILPILLCGLTLIRKIPCKEGKLGVQ